MNVSIIKCAGLAAVATFATGAMADNLITIDLSVVNQITMTATTGASAVTTSGTTFTGAYFEDFYGAAGTSLTATLVSGNLTSANNPSDNSPALFRGGAGSDPGLNLWNYSTAATSTFTAGEQAFAGSATWNVTGAMYADMLAGATSGDIYFAADTFDDLSSAVVLGTYNVVVPSTGTLPLLGLGLVGMRRRR